MILLALVITVLLSVVVGLVAARALFGALFSYVLRPSPSWAIEREM